MYACHTIGQYTVCCVLNSFRFCDDYFLISCQVTLVIKTHQSTCQWSRRKRGSYVGRCLHDSSRSERCRIRRPEWRELSTESQWPQSTTTTRRCEPASSHQALPKQSNCCFWDTLADRQTSSLQWQQESTTTMCYTDCASSHQGLYHTWQTHVLYHEKFSNATTTRLQQTV